MRLVLAAVLAALTCAGVARADEVFLRNGQQITGRVTEGRDEIVVAVPGGALRLRRVDVDRVEREPLAEDLYAARAARTDMSDPAAVRELAAFARHLNFDATAAELESTATQVELEKRVAAIDAKDGAAYRATARWARERGLGPAVERWLCERALAADPDDALARIELDRVGREERAAEAREQAEREQAERDATEAALEERER